MTARPTSRPALRLLALAPLVVLLAACGGEDTTVARDPGSSGAGGSSDPSAAGPPALTLPAQVRTANLAMVMDTGKGPEVCLGPIAESWPPQCSGPALLDWDWSAQEMHERQGRTRWGSFAITGSWDGEALAATDAIPAALYDVMAQEPSTPPDPDPPVPAGELRRIAEELPDLLPGVQGTYAAETHVLADVFYDDGSLQEWADATYGEGVVVLMAALVPADA
ncbi:MAG: hypothetical protein ACO1ON_14945 [Nocardioides sp.]